MFLGIDIGGTNIKLGIVDELFNCHKKYLMETPKHKGDIGMVEEIVAMCKNIYEEIPFEGIGIGTPGKIDAKEGVIEVARNLPYNNTPIIKIFREVFKMPVEIGNDGDCAALGEICAGIGKKYDDFVMLTIGTGIGGGIVFNKKLYKGISNSAGELGHTTIKCDGPECICGNKGCFEMYASVTALKKQTEEAIIKNPNSLLAELGKYQITGKTAFDAAKQGCLAGQKVVETYIEYIAFGIKNIIRVFDPQAIVLGGAISNEGETLLNPLIKKLPQNQNRHIIISHLGNDAGIIGAASLCMKKVNK